MARNDGMEKEKGCFGYKGDMGIPHHDESISEGLTPLKNRWTALHEVSMEEARRMVGHNAKERKMSMRDKNPLE